MANKFDGPYGNMNFPTYEFREYPKMIKDGTGKDVVVANKAEELKAMADMPQVEPSVAERERDSLAAQVAELQRQLEEAKRPKADNIPIESKGTDDSMGSPEAKFEPKEEAKATAELPKSAEKVLPNIPKK